MKRQLAVSLIGAVATIAAAGSVPAQAASCGNAGDFPRFLAEFKREAAGQGISRGTISALDRLSFDPAVIAADRRQAVFSQSFLEFSDRMVAKYRLQGGASLIRKHAQLFARIERDFIILFYVS
jgi:membrane-bound lytic murein transglycosylase B